MVGFGKHSLNRVFPVAFLTVSVLFPAMVMAATLGFYAGTFDPPTQAEMGMVRCAFGDTSFHKQYAQIGNPLSRIVVSVNESGEEDTLASARERALMVKKALQKYGDRVEIVIALGNREEATRALLQDRNIEQLVQFSDQTLGDSTIDEDEARLDVIDDSVYKLVSFLLPKVLAAE